MKNESRWLKNPPFAILLAYLSLTFSLANAETMDVVCSYAPSQSKAITAIASTTGGAAATTYAVGQALGLTVVSHSSGGIILTGSGGYVAGTLGTASAAPVVIGVGVIVAGTAVTVELVCAPKNHPELADKVYAAAAEFRSRSSTFIEKFKEGFKGGLNNAIDVKTEFFGKISSKSSELYRRYKD